MPPWEKYQQAPEGPWSKYGGSAPVAVEEPASTLDVVAGTPLVRLAAGAASPLIGAAQLGAHIGDWVNELSGVETVVSPWLDKKIQEFEAAKRRGMKASGREGFDWMGLFGSLVPSGAVAQGVTTLLPQNASLPAKMLAGGGAGAATAAAQPTVDDEFAASKAKQVATGAGAGAAVPLVAQALMAAKGLVEPFYQKGRELIIGRALNTAAGSHQPQAVQAMQTAREIVPGSQPTVGQASQNPGLASMERAASATTPEATNALQFRLDAQNAARLKALGSVAQNEQALEAARQAREAATAPMRQQALSQANVAGLEVPKLEQEIARREQAMAEALTQRAKLTPQPTAPDPGALKSSRDLFGYTPPSAPLRTGAEKAALGHGEEIIQRSAEGIKQAKDALASLPKPLEATDITRRMSGIASQPGLRASDVVSKSLSAIQDKISSLANQRGIVDANDLYMVRKEAANVIKKFADESKNFDQRLTAGLVKDVQGYIDDAIEQSGGTGWREYLTKYQELSKPISQMKVAQSIVDKSTNKLTGKLQPNAYGNALTDQTAKIATNYRQATLDEVMTPQQMQTLNAVKDDLIRSVQAREMAGAAGSDTVKKLAYSNLIDRAGVPTFLREFAPTQAVGNLLARVADTVYGTANRDIAEQLAQTMLNPKEAARIMMQAGPSRYSHIIDALIQQGVGGAGAAAGQLEGR